MKDKSYKRHIAKTITWRVIATLDTILLSWLITGNPLTGLKIGIAEVFTKMILYFFHERIWFKINLSKDGKVLESRKRHIAKTITWRFIGTLDTMVIAWIISGNPLTGLKIGFAEVLTKMLIYYFHERVWYKSNYGLEQRKHNLMKENIIPHNYQVDKTDRNKLNGHQSFLIWFTGLSGSGKSTIANALESRLFEKKIKTYTLDGDNIRKGINNDLSFSPEDRTENIRRIAEISKLFVDAGIVVLAAFVSPYRKDRHAIKNIVGKNNFVEVYINTSVEECEKRDVKGLYKKARMGEIKDFTGVNAPYESPESPDIEINTEQLTVEQSVTKIIKVINKKLKQ